MVELCQWWRIYKQECTAIFSGDDVSEIGVEKGKTLLNRMTYIMDQACLNDHMVKLGELLN
jgi:hypothetical protein